MDSFLILKRQDGIEQRIRFSRYLQTQKILMSQQIAVGETEEF